MLPVERLKSIPLFGELDDEQAAHVAPLFHRTRYKLGDVVSRQGDTGDAFYVLDNGTLHIRHVDVEAEEQEETLGVLNAPAYFGETSLLTGMARDATVQVTSPQADLLVVYKPEFDALLDQYPEIREKLVVRDQVESLLSQQAHPWLQSGEILLVQTRRHWYALVARLIVPALLSGAFIIAAVIAYFFLTSLTGNLLLSIALGVLAILTAVGTCSWNILDWSNDYYIVTNKRVIHVEKTVLILDEREEAPIEMITNVIEQSNGLPARMFGFTEIRIETSGRDVDINFTFAPASAHISQLIFEQMDRARDRAAQRQQERLRSEIRNELWERLAPQEAAERQAEESLPDPEIPPQMAFRSTRKTSLGRRLNELFGLTVETPLHVTWRKHWFVLIKQVTEPVVAVLLVVGIGLAHFSGIVPLRVFGVLDSTQVLLLVAGWVILLSFALFWLWYQYEDWSNDIYRVTDERLIDLEKSPFGLKTRSIETTLDRVQDVSYRQGSPVAVLLNYGDLNIETAGAGRFTFYGVQNPRRAMQEIFRRRDAHRNVQFDRQSTHDRKEFLDWFAEYHRFLEERDKSNRPPTATDEIQDGDSAPESDEYSGDA